jgi:unsaturated chondroitin disaccharide hydrolase
MEINKTIFENYLEISDDEIDKALSYAGSSVVENLKTFTDKFQNAYSENGFYKPIENTDWTTGFWTGEIWLAYEYATNHEIKDVTNGNIIPDAKDKLKNSADIQIKSFYDRIVNKIAVDHHDMGFLYSPSCVAGYKLTGSKQGREAAIMAADQLIRRFHPVGEFIQAWGAMDAPENYRLIIDCLLNLPLLYWASEETNDSKYREIAEKHIHTAVKNVIRDDYSTWHTFFFDPKTGAPDHGATCQGYRDGSAWTRGQAWGIYGMALAYKYTGREEYIDIFRHVTEYFLSHLPKDLVPYWDLEFNSGDDQPRDSSSASIAACGMLEMVKYLPQEERGYYVTVAKQLLKAVYDKCAVKDFKESNGLVLHSTYSNHSPYNTCNHYGVDECNAWGDYFYMEALTRLMKKWNPYW